MLLTLIDDIEAISMGTMPLLDTLLPEFTTDYYQMHYHY